MDTKTASNTESSRVAEEPPALPEVIAKKRLPADGGDGEPKLSKDEQNAAEIARLSAWATGDCGKPILAD